MSDKAFVDSNVLIYAIEQEGANVSKATVARDMIERVRPTLSTQVLGEFYNVVTGKRRTDPLSSEEAAQWIAKWMQLKVESVTPDHVNLALEICHRFQVSYYDALILAACTVVYSEDLNDGQDYGGVKVINPFAGLAS
jgi:predicted nucleic acid-binding protein